jgi:hypothetical protein
MIGSKNRLRRIWGEFAPGAFDKNDSEKQRKQKPSFKKKIFIAYERVLFLFRYRYVGAYVHSGTVVVWRVCFAPHNDVFFCSLRSPGNHDHETNDYDTTSLD